MFFPLISRSDYQFLASLLSVSTVKIKNRFRDDELSLDKLRHECSNYDEVRLNKINNTYLNECFVKYDKDRVVTYLKLMVNSLIAKAMLEAAQTLRENSFRSYRANLAKVDSELEELRTLYELTDLKVSSLEEELFSVKTHNIELAQRLQAAELQLKATNDSLEQLIQEAIEAATATLHTECDRLNQLCFRQDEILSVQHFTILNLSRDLSLTKQELAATRQELSDVKARLTISEQDLGQIKQELLSTKQELLSTKQELLTNQREFSDSIKTLSSEMKELQRALAVEREELNQEINNEEDALRLLPRIQAGITAKVMPLVNFLKVDKQGSLTFKVRKLQLERWITALMGCAKRCAKFIDVGFELSVLELAHEKYITQTPAPAANPIAISNALRKRAKGFGHVF